MTDRLSEIRERYEAKHIGSDGFTYCRNEIDPHDIDYLFSELTLRDKMLDVAEKVLNRIAGHHWFKSHEMTDDAKEALSTLRSMREDKC